MTNLLAFSLLSCAVLLFSFCNSENSGTASDNSESQSRSKISSFVRDSSAIIDSIRITYYLPVNTKVGLTDKRPSKGDSNVIMCCAAAFTLLENDKIDGLFIVNGNVRSSKVNRNLGGGMSFPSDGSTYKCTIAGTEMGARLDSLYIDSLIRNRNSYFQQIQLVRDGQSLVFRKDVSLFQRRAVCILHGQAVVVESYVPCTLQKFADILRKSGIQNAIYLDMGSWDEGWYRTHNDSINTIGLLRNSTGRQSNWIVYGKY